MRTLLSRTTCFVLATVLLFGCKAKVEELETEPLSDYLPLQTGKYITYQLDSTVYTELGRQTEVHSYQEKFVVDAQFTDNTGQPSYRLYRYLRDSAGEQPWHSGGTYVVTPYADRIETVEDNMRVISLHGPMREGFTWKGNKYLSSAPYGSLYNFTDAIGDLSDWDFVYGEKGDENIGGNLIPDVRTVNYDIFQPSLNVQNNRPIIDTNYAYNIYYIDKYAKNIGLVYQERIIWEHQNNPTKFDNSPQHNAYEYSPFTVGFGVKRTLLDHN